MKILITAAVLTLALSGCWKDAGDRRAEEFMSNLAKCDNCQRTKPFLGPGSTNDGN